MDGGCIAQIVLALEICFFLEHTRLSPLRPSHKLFKLMKSNLVKTCSSAFYHLIETLPSFNTGNGLKIYLAG